jgi:hypothetical protein
MSVEHLAGSERTDFEPAMPFAHLGSTGEIGADLAKSGLGMFRGKKLLNVLI